MIGCFGRPEEQDEVKAQQAKEDSGEEEGGKDFISSLVDIHKHFVDVFEKCCVRPVPQYGIPGLRSIGHFENSS